MFVFDKIAIIGLGLIGGSLAKTIKKNKISKQTIAFSLDEQELKLAKSQNMIDEIADSIKNACADSNIIIICTPLSVYPEIINLLEINENQTVTDVGSVKNCVLEFIEDSHRIDNFIPSHPICGAETTGYEASVDNLFYDKKVIITPKNTENNKHYDKIKLFWQMCGAKTEVMTATKHDKIYAKLSHLPQLLSFKYKNYLDDNFLEYKNITDDGFKRFMRISNSSPVVWSDIFYYNNKQISEAYNDFIYSLNDLKSTLDNPKNFTSEIAEKLEIRRKIFVDDKMNHVETKDYNFFSYQKLIPLILSASIMNKNFNYSYAGSGFCDFSSCLLYNLPEIELQLENNFKNIKYLLNQFFDEFIYDKENFISNSNSFSN